MRPVQKLDRREKRRKMTATVVRIEVQECTQNDSEKLFGTDCEVSG